MIPCVLAPAPETPELGPGRPGLGRTQQVAGDTRILETRECCHVIKCDEKIFRGLIFSNSVSLIFSWPYRLCNTRTTFKICQISFPHFTSLHPFQF